MSCFLFVLFYIEGSLFLMGRKRRGHGWSRKKGYSKKCVQSRKDVEVTNVVKAQSSVLKTQENSSQQKLTSTSQRSAEEWYQYLLDKYGGHTTQCHFFGIRRGCIACWNNYRNSVGGGVLASGGFEWEKKYMNEVMWFNLNSSVFICLPDWSKKQTELTCSHYENYSFELITFSKSFLKIQIRFFWGFVPIKKFVGRASLFRH